MQAGSEVDYNNVCQKYIDANKELDDKATYLKIMADATAFMHQTNSYAVIQGKINQLTPLEDGFKKNIKNILQDEIYQEAMTSKIKDSFNEYLSNTHNYYYSQNYNNTSISKLFSAMYAYQQVLNDTRFNCMRNTLNYFTNLEYTKVIEA